MRGLAPITIFLTVASVLLLGRILYQFTRVGALRTELQNEKDIRMAQVDILGRRADKLSKRVADVEKKISDSAGDLSRWGGRT